MIKKYYFWIALLAGILLSCSQQESVLSVSEFRDPGIENRPLALWTWMNGYVDRDRMVYELEEMMDKGMRGALIWDIGSLSDPDKMIPAGPGFLGPESLETIGLALKTASRLGLDLGMVASSSWNAGGEWIEPADASMQILMTRKTVRGPGKQKLRIAPPENNGKPVEKYFLITSMALPYSGNSQMSQELERAIYLDKLTQNQEIIEWEVPEGEWEVFSFFSCNTMQNLVCPSPNSNGLVIDHLSRLATQNHFDSLINRLATISSPENHLKLFMLDSYEVYEMNDWSPGFLQEFKNRYQYDATPYLPLLADYQFPDSIIAERFRNDYRRLVSDLMIENHFGQSVDIANKYGAQMITEAGHGGSPRVDALKALGHSHIPMGEFWNRQRFWVTKEAASAAHIYGLNRVAAESLTGWNHWQHGPADFKQLIDIAFCEGLNQVVFHTFAHNPEIAGKPGFVYHAGEHINVNTTWWEMARPFMDYIARSSYLLRQGLFVGDACLYYGDQAPNLVPPKRIDPNIKPIFDDTQCLHCGQPKPVNPGKVPGYDYDYMNAEILTTALRVEDGRLVLPSGQSYRVLVLPDKEAISLEVLRAVEKLVANGAVVLGRRPLRSTSLENYPDCDLEIQEIADRLWGSCDGKQICVNSFGSGKIYWGKTLEEVLQEINVPRDFDVQGIDNCDNHIDYIHRQTSTEDIYFVSNSLERSEKIKTRFRVPKNRYPQIWDPLTGFIQRDVEYQSTDQGILLDLELEALGSRFIIFTPHKSRKNDPEFSRNLQYISVKRDAEDLESLDLSGDWQVHFDPAWGGPGNFSMQKLISWSEASEPGVASYSGKALYEKHFVVSKDQFQSGKTAVLQLDSVQEMARVWLNGQDCGTIWTPPYQTILSPHLREGENTLKIEVINTWNNRLVGESQNPDWPQYTNTNIKNRFRKGQFLPSGIMGKASIHFLEK